MNELYYFNNYIISVMKIADFDNFIPMKSVHKMDD